MEKLRQQAYDELLVLRCQDGEAPAFDELVRRWQKKLWRHARCLTGSDETAWDMTQETWMAVVRGIRRLDDPVSFRTWVYRILVHKCSDWIRGKQRDRNVKKDLLSDAQLTAVGSSRNPHDDLGVRKAVAALPYDSRLVVTLFYQQGLTVVEISEVVGVPVGTVKSRLHQARSKLKDKLKSKT